MVAPNPEFISELFAAGGDGAKMCFQCGTCTAGCPSGKITAYRIRKLMRMAQLGLKEDIISSEDLWQCTTCYTCEERCPRGVPIVDVVIALRNIAVANGKMFPAHKKTGQNLVAYGHAVAINDKIKAQRKELGLDEVPPTVLANEKAMADLSVILEATGFKKLVE
ncbi:CoB--CoM heterodisulfide reductase subunit C [Candidatus Methanarcanum hacksteinii]|uniref:CoB--CoM heterodisulfide reductase subunit C n=1 Tax=Candidatus Methanarcanum hacksteinii TaxID=2911857 RepID=UPI0037DC5CBE